MDFAGFRYPRDKFPREFAQVPVRLIHAGLSYSPGVAGSDHEQGRPGFEGPLQEPTHRRFIAEIPRTCQRGMPDRPLAERNGV